MSSLEVRRWQIRRSLCETTSGWRLAGLWVASTRERPGCLPCRRHRFIRTSEARLSAFAGTKIWASSINSQTMGNSFSSNFSPPSVSFRRAFLPQAVLHKACLQESTLPQRRRFRFQGCLHPGLLSCLLLSILTGGVPSLENRPHDFTALK